MKTFHPLLLVCTFVFLPEFQPEMQGVVLSEMSARKRAENTEVADFLIGISQSHLLALKEGDLAIEKGTVEEIRAYGAFMVREQTRLLTEIRVLAVNKRITLPEALTKKDARFLEKLKTKSGQAFNKGFVHSMQSIHRKSLKEFRTAASRIGDKEVSAFAAQQIHNIDLQCIRIDKMEERL